MWSINTTSFMNIWSVACHLLMRSWMAIWSWTRQPLFLWFDGLICITHHFMFWHMCRLMSWWNRSLTANGARLGSLCWYRYYHTTISYPEPYMLWAWACGRLSIWQPDLLTASDASATPQLVWLATLNHFSVISATCISLHHEPNSYAVTFCLDFNVVTVQKVITKLWSTVHPGDLSSRVSLQQIMFDKVLWLCTMLVNSVSLGNCLARDLSGPGSGWVWQYWLRHDCEQWLTNDR